MAAQISADAKKVAELVSGFQYTVALCEEVAQQAPRSTLQEALKHAEQKQEESRPEIDSAKELVKEAQAALQKAVEAEEAAASELVSKAEVVATAKAELSDAKGAYEQAERSGAKDAKEGQQLREAKARNEEVTKGPFTALLEGAGWADEEASAAAIKAVQDYLEEIRVEKALVAAVPGLSLKPEERGVFDKETAEFISEVLAEKLRELEEQQASRAPAEKEAKTELMGLSALVDVCQEKVQAAEAERETVQAAIKSSKASMKQLKGKVAKAEKTVENLLASQSLEEEKAKAATEALAALERLCEAASAEAASQQQTAAEDGKRPADAEEPDAKKARVEEPAEFTVASPARATRSRLSMPSRPIEEVA
eukprot:TRINITY_DN4061_c0_g1_i1.p1 TRINITY_DN4061_c0_g1~~TRINITY_DN4061_c0_g1_i1.p1  ORF type:complete len:392 (-),score=157.74 TRINITY_DN4061_c0_g1_i1:164-1267(-)